MANNNYIILYDKNYTKITQIFRKSKIIDI